MPFGGFDHLIDVKKAIEKGRQAILEGKYKWKPPVEPFIPPDYDRQSEASSS